MSDLSIHADLFILPLATSPQTLTQPGLPSHWSPLPLEGPVGGIEGTAEEARGYKTFVPAGSSGTLQGDPSLGDKTLGL